MLQCNAINTEKADVPSHLLHRKGDVQHWQLVTVHILVVLGGFQNQLKLPPRHPSLLWQSGFSGGGKGSFSLNHEATVL